MPRKNWTREELILAFNLYCKIPFGQNHHNNPHIIALAEIIGRTPNAVSWKLANFARLDPSLKERDLTGAGHGSKRDVEIWNEFSCNWELLAFESERLLAERTGQKIENLVNIDEGELPKEGTERESIIRTRVNQNFFRATILTAYNYQCCITELSVPELLIAGHIVPWSIDQANRLNPHNGLCLSVLHERAFDRGFLTILPDYTVKISPMLKKLSSNSAVNDFLLQYDGSPIKRPTRFLPNLTFIKFHNERIFQS